MKGSGLFIWRRFEQKAYCMKHSACWKKSNSQTKSNKLQIIMNLPKNISKWKKMNEHVAVSQKEIFLIIGVWMFVCLFKTILKCEIDSKTIRWNLCSQPPPPFYLFSFSFHLFIHSHTIIGRPYVSMRCYF